MNLEILIVANIASTQQVPTPAILLLVILRKGKYEIGMVSSGIISIQSSVQIGPLVRKLKR
jgi:hypothetical protein